MARVIIDSFRTANQHEDFELILSDNNLFDDKKPSIRSEKSIASILLSKVEITQTNGLDFMSISVESPSPTEAALIANAYAKVYKEFNLMESRKQLTQIKDFLTVQKEEKFNELMIAEDNIKVYQLQGGGIELGQQASSLIGTLSQFESQRNAVKIEMSIEAKKLEEYTGELSKRDPSLSNYFDLQTAQPSIAMLQKEIANVETQKAIALSGKGSGNQKEILVKDLDTKLGELRKKLSIDISAYQSKVYSASPEEVKELSNKIFTSEVNLQALKAQSSQLSQVLSQYETEFQSLPKKSLDLARLEREKQSLEKLYVLLENKYQEALLNEQSTPGNVLILNAARPPESPDKPNRVKIIFIGLISGLFVAFIFIYGKNLLNKTIKTPEDVENIGLYILASIPKFERKIGVNTNNSEIFMNSENEIAASEAYRALRTRIQFSKLTDGAKSILITSSAPQEGKTTVAVNLGASFAQTNKKVIILDCDLRIPRIHSVFKGNSSPGFTNFLFGQATFEEIVRKSNTVENLYYIAAGTIPSNPSEILGSNQMRDFLANLKLNYDLVVVDSPPVMTITDAEILSHIVDISILVVFANKTEADWVTESANLLQNGETNSFVGVILNNFDYNTGYRSYHKYNTSKYYKRVDESKQNE
ncbi:MAG: polysaccharide biosynthesis tyrosine autokinase, partial [Ignavibacteriae bacterium]|nr:polysaccharide biosynthesis tyrosine autokinase [Ignavibacteriota bacterium]